LIGHSFPTSIHSSLTHRHAFHVPVSAHILIHASSLNRSIDTLSSARLSPEILSISQRLTLSNIFSISANSDGEQYNSKYSLNLFNIESSWSRGIETRQA
jgi:hypothetical protein